MTTSLHQYAVRAASFGAIALTCLWTGGCGYAAPALRITDARATERTPDGLAMLFTVEARNENIEALPLRDVDYSVELNGRRVFVGTRSAEATIRRLGAQTFTLPAVVNLHSDPSFADISGPVSYRVAGSLRYVTPGQLAEVLFDSGVHVPSVGFSGDGQIDFSTAQTVMPAPLSENPLQVEIKKSAEPPSPK